MFFRRSYFGAILGTTLEQMTHQILELRVDAEDARLRYLRHYLRGVWGFAKISTQYQWVTGHFFYE